MARNPEVTKRRIFDAAVAEFARHGIAGARIDRIARAARANKQLIYAYFGNKQDLFDQVVTEQVARYVEEVHFDAERLPDFAGEAYDFFTAHPDVVRLGEWHSLEPADASHPIPAIEETIESHVRAIRAAQEAGRVDDTFAPEELLALIVSITRTWAAGTPEFRLSLEQERRRRLPRRRAVVEITRRLVEPQRRPRRRRSAAD
jgi:AcrR family transcriptional regulator